MLLLASCSKDADRDVGMPVSFSVADQPETVSRVVTGSDGKVEFEDGDEMGVFAWYLPGGDEAKAEEFMINQKVTLEDGAWGYSPVKYWPAASRDRVCFFAYAPHAASGTGNPYELNGKTYMDIPLDGTEDILWARQITTNGSIFNPGDGIGHDDGRTGLKFTFGHLMKMVKFQFIIQDESGYGEGHHVERMEIHGQKNSASIGIEDGSLTLNGAETTYVLGNGANRYAIVNYASATTVKDALYLHPSVSEIDVTLSVSGVDYPAKITGLGTDNEGGSYLVRLYFSNTTVATEVTLTDWVTGIDKETGELIEWL